MAYFKIDTLQHFIPGLNSTKYEMWYSSSRYEKIAVKSVYIDGKKFKKGEKYNINKKINIKMEYYYDGSFKDIREKEISFSPSDYFKNKSKNSKLDNFGSKSHFYNVFINDLI